MAGRNDSANVLIIQDEWDGYIEDIITREIGNDVAYDLITDLGQAMELLADTGYGLILTEPMLARGDEVRLGVLPLIEFCAQRWPETRIVVISITAALEDDALEQLDLANVSGVYSKPIDSEAVTEIASLLEDL